jgi:hypothetical protein
MSEFNYEQLSVEVLEAEKTRVEETITTLEHKHRLLEAAIGSKTMERLFDEGVEQ